jgi:hypothetical protein
MSFDLTNGYQPRTFEEILEAFVLEVNEQFSTTYDATSIVGTEYYRFFYAGAQLVMQSESYTAEITTKMTDYIRTANEAINLPKSTINGFITGIKTDLGLDATIKDIVLEAEAGYMFLIVDADETDPDYATTKQAIIDRMHDWLTAALYYNGTETGSKVALNGQTFNYKFGLPVDVDILVRVTVTASANSTSPVLNENQIRDILDANLALYYRIGLDFEPEKYLEISRDLPFASDILLEYSENAGATWLAVPRSMAYDKKINLTAPATISVV